MKIITNLAIALIVLSLGWMTIQTIYGVGRAKGIVETRQELMMQNESRISQAYQEGFEKCLEQC